MARETPAGRADFAGLRTAYITLGAEVGASVKDLQTLARHSTPTLTMNVYAKSRPEHLVRIVEAISERIGAGERAYNVHAKAIGAEGPVLTPAHLALYDKRGLVAAEGFEPPTRGL